MKENNHARISILISMLLFGTIGIAVRGVGMPSAVLALFRAAIGGISIIVFSRIKGNHIDFKAIRENFLLLFVSGVMLGFNWILLFEAYNYTSVATATLCYYLQPVILILVSPLLLKEKLTPKKLLCTLVAMLGMVLVSGVFEGGFSGDNRYGILLALGAAVLYAAIIICNKRMGPMVSFDRVASQLLLAVPAMLVYVLLNGQFREISFTVGSAFGVLVLGVLYTGVTYMLFYGSLPYVSSQTAAILSYVDPATAVLVSGVFEGGFSGDNRYGILLALGAAVLYAAIIVCNKRMGPMVSFDRVASQLLLAVPAMLVYVLLNGQFREISFTVGSAFGVLVLGVLYTGVTYMLFYGSLPYVSSQTAAILSYVDPATAVLVSVIFLGEPMSFLMMAGAALILGTACVSELKN